ncbi:WD40 repeat-like protein [Suillus weaverae]|nr:WD40 repeat-like protein [Suillus weaverae]
MSQLIPSTIPLRTFEGHEECVNLIAVFPDKRRMVTSSKDKTLRLWDLETGVVLKKMEGHTSVVQALAVSRDGQLIASGDTNGELMTWHGETGESLTQPIKGHSRKIVSLDFSPDGTVLATASYDKTTAFWCTKTWQMQGEPIQFGAYHIVSCVRYSPSGELLAIATAIGGVQIYNPGTRERVASLKGRDTGGNFSLAWTPDGTRLLSAGSHGDPTIREWDSLTWQQVGRPWGGHTSNIYAIAIHPAGTLVASASRDGHVRLWRLSDQQTIAIFQHSSPVQFITFSADGKHILTGSQDNKISEWAAKGFLAITTARDACIAGDLSTAEELLTQEIHTNANDHTLYAHRSFIMARKHDWDHALEDAIKHSALLDRLYLQGHCPLRTRPPPGGKGSIRRRIHVHQPTFENQPLSLLTKAIALFSADQHDEAMLLIKELAAACPTTDPLTRRVVETYLRVQLGINAFDRARHDEAADHFTVAVNSGTFSSKYIHEIYEEFTMLFGWDLKSLCLTTHQKRCQAFLSLGKPDEALEAHKFMMDTIDDSAKDRCSALAEQNDRILGAEIPGQGQDGYDTDPNFFHGMHQHSQISRPRPQPRPGRVKRLRLAMKRTPRSTPPPATASAPGPGPAPTHAPPTTTPPATVPTTITAWLGNLFTRPHHHAAPPIVDVPFAQGKERNAIDGPKDVDDGLIRDEDYHGPPTPDPNLQQQAVAVQVDPGEHGGGRSCCCC